MNSRRWLSRAMIEALHAESNMRFGGADGIRDEGLLESALARPRNRIAYDSQATVFDLAANYCAGIIGNHPFIDGNKRTSLLSARVFLTLNNYRFEPGEALTVEMIRGLAAGTVEAVTLAYWIENSSTLKD